ncbi:MAG: isoprenyl transferase [Candidatus Omnitrophica bacterium]|nr:isoprenyl transferase [Candidatus Omnitrophota bacterium]
MIDKNNIPKHVAIIMDGNGRWAKEKGLPRTAGHRAGIDRIKEIVNAARELGIQAITFFAFSTENWSRPKTEVNMLMRSLGNFLERQIKDLDKDNIRFRVIGREHPLPKYLLAKIKESENKTKDNNGLTVVLALNYGARQEIIDAVKKLSSRALGGKTDLNDLEAEDFGRYLYTAGLPDPDLLIRTSGEMRISNFLLWQLSYAELYFPRVYWPDFKKEDLEEAIEVYQKRERRFGGIDVNKADN